MVACDDYLLRCYRYIELNPVTANMVTKPEEYPWSSFLGNAFGRPDELLSPHASYSGLALCDEERHYAYRELFQAPLSMRCLPIRFWVIVSLKTI